AGQPLGRDRNGVGLGTLRLDARDPPSDAVELRLGLAKSLKGEPIHAHGHAPVLLSYRHGRDPSSAISRRLGYDSPMAFGLEGRHVVITGGAGALGQAVVRAFAGAGAVCHLPIRGRAELPAGAAVNLVPGGDP